MVSVAVVGGGFAGMAVAVRLAKLGHAVVLLEAGDTVGGQLRAEEREGYSFDNARGALTMPAVLRDLFAKSGRPLERALELRHLAPGRRHVFADKTELELPLGSRSDQMDAIEAVLPGQGAPWSRWIDEFDPQWEILRRQALDRPFAGRSAISRDQWRALRPRRYLRTSVRANLENDHLRALALSPVLLGGHQPRSTPAFVAVTHLVERNFGRWQVEGGSPHLVDALATRLQERRVDVRLDTTVHGLHVVDESVHGVLIDRGSIEADVVVWAAPGPPRPEHAYGGIPLIPAARTYLGLRSGARRIDVETVVHADPPVQIVPSTTHAGPGQAWTVEHRSGSSEDVVRTLARHGIDVREHIDKRWDVSAVDRLRTRGHADGWQWQGWRTGVDRPGVGYPLSGSPNLFRVGVNAHPGPSLEMIAMGTAAVASQIGRA